MPTNRGKRGRAIVRQDISEAMKNYAETGQYCREMDGFFDVFRLEISPKMKIEWNRVKDQILDDFIKLHPGKRPYLWWQYDAPRSDKKLSACYNGELPEPRQRLGGVGTPVYEVLAYKPLFRFGIPTRFCTEFDVSYYKNFQGVAYDPDDPPLYESQAAYLGRHDLLNKTEQIYLKNHPALLTPEMIKF